jgi:hypothetical protein
VHYVTPEKISIHPNYHHIPRDTTDDHGVDQYINDYAILSLNSPIEPNLFNANPICLPLGINADFSGQKLSAIGWGHTLNDEEEDVYPTIMLQEAQLTVLNQKFCSLLWGPKVRVIIVGKKSKQDIISLI